MSDILASIAIVVWVFAGAFVYLRTTRVLLRIKKESPLLLQSVGMHKVNWGLRSILGIFRLGFTSGDNKLKRSDILLFRSAIYMYIGVMIFFVVAVISHLISDK